MVNSFCRHYTVPFIAVFIIHCFILGEIACLGQAHGIRPNQDASQEHLGEEETSFEWHDKKALLGPHPVYHHHHSHHHHHDASDHNHDHDTVSEQSRGLANVFDAPPNAGMYCGAPEPTRDDIRAARRAERTWLQQLWEFLKVLFREFFRTSPSKPTTKIPTYYHIIQTSTVLGPSESVVNAQNDMLNEAFSAAGFAFEKKGVTRTLNNAWYSYSGFNTQEELDMKSTLRTGGAESLNIYINGANGYCGYAYLPRYYESFPVWDGVVLNTNCFLGGTAADRAGETLIHETGHWLGLFHTVRNRNLQRTCIAMSDVSHQQDIHLSHAFVYYFSTLEFLYNDSLPMGAPIQGTALTTHRTKRIQPAVVPPVPPILVPPRRATI